MASPPTPINSTSTTSSTLDLTPIESKFVKHRRLVCVLLGNNHEKIGQVSGLWTVSFVHMSSEWFMKPTIVLLCARR